MADEYIKGRDFISASKLNYFHYFLKQLIGNNIHTDIQLDDRQCRIADLSTKTVIWPIDVAESLPHVHIDAFERTDKLFPTAERLPENVKLHVHDIYQPFSSAFIGQFDLVSLRLLSTLTLEQLEKLVANAVKLLKPGGYIQWVEYDKTTLHVTKPDTSLDSLATEAMIELQRNPFPNYNFSWTDSIATSFKSQGLVIIANDRVEVRKTMLSQLHELHLLSMLDIPLGLSGAVDEYREEYLERYKKEFEAGVLMVDGFIVVVGRKEMHD